MHAAAAPPAADLWPARVRAPEANRARFGALFDAMVAALDRGDPLADAVVAHPPSLRALDRALRGEPAPAPARALYEAMRAVDADPERLDRGGRVLLRAGPIGGLVLGACSLVLGYCAPAGNKPLVLSGQLHTRARRRLDETARFVQAVNLPGGLAPGADGFVITGKVRVMHAAVRGLALRSGRWDHAAWSLPVNQHDMVATILLFSSILLGGLELMGLRVDRGEAEDYVHLWRHVGALIGVEPHLLPADRGAAEHLTAFIGATQRPPDDDSRALARALFDAYRPPGSGPGLDEAACRYLIGDHLADALGLRPSRRWAAWLRTSRRLVGRADALRSRVPALDAWQLAWGARRWQAVVQSGLRDAPARFDAPQRLS